MSVTEGEYLLDPCGASSLPFWKTNLIVIPDDMRVILDDVFSEEDAAGFSDERFFKLVRDLSDLKEPVLPEGYAPAAVGEEELARHIAECYGGGPSAEELRAYRDHPVFDADLLIAVKDDRGRIAATGIAELDRSIGEGVIEWIQVSAADRRRGLGEYLVRELVWRMRGKASFVTVSGRVDDPSEPMRLYQKCGFGNMKVWHVLKRD